MKFAQVGYGHDGRGVGKTALSGTPGYTYLVSDNVRTGDNLVPIATSRAGRKFVTEGQVLKGGMVKSFTTKKGKQMLSDMQARGFDPTQKPITTGKKASELGERFLPTDRHGVYLAKAKGEALVEQMKKSTAPVADTPKQSAYMGLQKQRTGNMQNVPIQTITSSSQGQHTTTAPYLSGQYTIQAHNAGAIPQQTYDQYSARFQKAQGNSTDPQTYGHYASGFTKK